MSLLLFSSHKETNQSVGFLKECADRIALLSGDLIDYEQFHLHIFILNV